MSHRPLVFIDIETTGASAWTSRVLEIGALRVENNQVMKHYSQLVDPEETIPPFITNLTGIQERDIRDKPTFYSVANDVKALFEDAIFVAHNVNFDYSFIKEEFRRLGVPFNKDRLCTVRLSRALHPAQKSHRLDEVIRVHGYKVANRHRAFDDAEILHRFYVEHLAKHGIDIYRTMDKLLQRAR